jgi:hypothetical protein
MEETDADRMKMNRKNSTTVPIMKPNMEAKKNLKNCFILFLCDYNKDIRGMDFSGVDFVRFRACLLKLEGK